MKIVFTILFYLLGVQSSLSSSPAIIDPNICSSEEKEGGSCELHCISKVVESKLLSFDNFISFCILVDDHSLKIKNFNLLFRIEPNSNSPPKIQV